MDEPVSRLKHPLRNIDNNGAYKLNPDEIDPKYYAPTPDEHLTRTLRLQNGNANRNDLSIDLRTRETGYLGDGKFSPTIFDKLGHNDENQRPKPNVPPKIPKGLTAAEYYILEKERYLNDLKGQRL
ncbi:uncharacterized protein PRCAT00002228001 [Priceomyces carsonii]|uniref:uncharacterized protein n=1 Tax=Priceomyces carsonii TaxID=28549 RepID=UPI002ED9592A|nr:unnamed protein product [Priceomyces carsonii]